MVIIYFLCFGNYEILDVCIVYDIHSVIECKLNTLTGFYSPMELFIYTTIARQCHTLLLYLLYFTLLYLCPPLNVVT